MTHRTLVRLLARVCTQVDLVRRSIHKGHGAMATFKWLLERVSLAVALHVGAVGEGALAYVTLEWPLSRVRAKVHFQVS